jgi:LPXTG-motif cell wall-anchored protein
MKKSLAAIALAGSIALIGAVPAVAAQYPAPAAVVAVDNASPGPGETFTFRGRAGAFFNNEPITLTVTPVGAPSAAGTGTAGGPSLAVPAKITLPLAPQTFSTTAASDGSFAFPLSISTKGVYTLTATGATSGKTFSATVTVEASAAGTGGTALSNTGGGAALANTGADASLVLWSLVGAGALAAGATSVVVVRRRAKAEAAA